MKRTISEIGEFGLIRMIDELISREGVVAGDLKLGIGDDAACFTPRGGFELLLTCDSAVEGCHFIPECFTPGEIGRRVMTANISDIGAMGGAPKYSTISLGLKPSTRVKDVLEIYRGFLRELKPFNASIVGGNITNSSETFFIDITLIGEIKKGKAVSRSTAKVGDVILVTGYPGEAAAGLKILLDDSNNQYLKGGKLVQAYKNPSHRAVEGRAIADSGYAGAMIDTSDGLLGDLGHICEASHVGAELIREKLPMSDELMSTAGDMGVDPFELVLGESDDYELVVTCAPENKNELKSIINSINGVPVTEVGRLVNFSEGIRIINPDNGSERLTPSGWDHFRQ
jgi:thiamine-monophosphate kinase